MFFNSDVLDRFDGSLTRCVIFLSLHVKFYALLYFIFALQECVFGDFLLTKEEALNGSRCVAQDISPLTTLKDAKMHAQDDEFFSSGRLISEPIVNSIQEKHLDESVCLVDYREDATPTNHPPGASSIDVNENESFSTDQAASNMLLSTREKRHVCKHCGKQFKHKGNFIKHVRTHTGERPYSCDHCGYKCSLKHDLTVHIRRHTGERPYSCDQCEYKYSRKSDLTTHIRTHTGDKPFSCTVCGKSFARNFILKQHQLTHTGDKQHKCDQCGKRFGQKSNLTTHLLTHSDNKHYSCDTCGKKFHLKSNLTQHLRTHTDDKPYGCGICGKMFKQSSGRNCHVKRCSISTNPS